MHAALPPCCLCLAALLGSSALAQDTPRAGEQQVLALLLQRYDKNHDRKIERSEYSRTDDAFLNLDRDKNGGVDAADFAIAPRRPSAKDLPDERGMRLPKVGDEAPDFELPMFGMKGTTVKLSSFRGDKPVALVFGSYT